MKTTIDAAGRLVVTMTLKRKGKGVVAIPAQELPPLSADQVRDTLERVRRA